MNNFINYLKKKILKEDAPTNNIGGGEVSTLAKPISMQKRSWGGKKEFVVPHDQYVGMRQGRQKGSKWDTFVPAGEVQEAIRAALYKDGAAVVTSDFTNASVILKHYKQNRWRQNDEVTLS